MSTLGEANWRSKPEIDKLLHTKESISHIFTYKFKQLDYTSNICKSGTPDWEQQFEIIVSIEISTNWANRERIKTRENIKHPGIFWVGRFWNSYVAGADVSVLRNHPFAIFTNSHDYRLTAHVLLVWLHRSVPLAPSGWSLSSPVCRWPLAWSQGVGNNIPRISRDNLEVYPWI